MADALDPELAFTVALAKAEVRSEVERARDRRHAPYRKLAAKVIKATEEGEAYVAFVKSIGRVIKATGWTELRTREWIQFSSTDQQQAFASAYEQFAGSRNFASNEAFVWSPDGTALLRVDPWGVVYYADPLPADAPFTVGSVLTQKSKSLSYGTGRA